jgi:diguanylate cyclase (GGDEF)-like protein/PAS domain S-box-containing protein
LSALEVLRDAAAAFGGARSFDAVAAIAEQAVSRLSPDGCLVQLRIPEGADEVSGDDLVAVASTPPGTGAPTGALLVDRNAAARNPVELQVVSVLAELAIERVRLSCQIVDRGQDQLNALAEQTADVILIVDDDNRIRYASPSARVLLGTSALRDAPLLDLVDPAERRSAEYLLRYARRAGPSTGGGGSRADWTVHTPGGRVAQVEVSCRDLRAEESVRGLVVTLRDVTNQRRLEHELTRQMFQDPLTELPNRLLFDERVSEAVAAGTGVTGILLIDLDNFRATNEALGRETGDALLKSVASRLHDVAGEDNLTARLAGDEFGVLVPNATDVQVVDELAARVVDALAPAIVDGDGALSCAGSVGIATTAEADTEEELLRHGDLALDAAKASGGGRWSRYDPAMSSAVRYRLEMRSALSQALRDESLVVEYQPIVALDTGTTAGLEALVRWQHPTRGLLSPGEFIDIAEESGLIMSIGERVLATAIRMACQWQRPAGDDPYVSVNISVKQFRSSGFVDLVRRLLVSAGLPPDRLVLEITESLLLRDDDAVWEDLKRLRQWGIRVAIDDFGTGYSALGYLRQVPLDIVKLDRVFISTMATSARQRELVRGIVRLTQTLNLATVAEGIETEGQRAAAADIGCTSGQGYLFSPAMSAAETTAWIANEGTAPAHRRAPKGQSSEGAD